MTSLNVSWMPSGNPQLFIGFDQGDYGDVVIWIGRLYVSWNWRTR